MIILHNTITNKTIVTRNSISDDFVRFIVKAENLQPAQLKIFITSKTREDDDMKGMLRVNANALEVYRTDFTGSLETEDIVVTGETLIHTHALQELNYPYDEDGKFDSKLWEIPS